MADQEELIAAGRAIEDIRERIGASSLAYLSLDALQQATPSTAELGVSRVSDGEYPTVIPDDLKLRKLRFEPAPA